MSTQQTFASQTGSDTDLILKVENLTKHFGSTGGLLSRVNKVVKAVDGVSFEVRRGETVGLVGESGCGKTTVGRTIARLYDPTSGTVDFNGQDISTLGGKDLKAIRSNIQMIFQDPYSSLNPKQTVGKIIEASFAIHGIEPEGGVRKAVADLLARVGLNPEHVNRFPHEFSGGQRQRIGIARAIALRPSLIICDEPVSALDVSIQAQVVNLLDDLQSEFGLSYLFIAHDLSVVQHISDRVVVMYLGKIMEVASTHDLFASPQHPYTKALLSAVPIPDPEIERKRERIILSGDLPSPANPPSGCVFRTRCWKAQEICSTAAPELLTIGNRQFACHFPENN
jgi:oligopeptide/dipeptide ABC transporter ATP-binding protein